MRKLGTAIRTIRLVKELTVNEIADKTGLSEQHLHHIEAGTRNPTLDTLDKIADALGLNAALLLFVSDMNDPLTQPLLPMVYMTVYNKIVPEGSVWKYP